MRIRISRKQDKRGFSENNCRNLSRQEFEIWCYAGTSDMISEIWEANLTGSFGAMPSIISA